MQAPAALRPRPARRRAAACAEARARRQVKQLLGRPLPRAFGPPRRVRQLAPGCGFNIVPPPLSLESPARAPAPPPQARMRMAELGHGGCWLVAHRGTGIARTGAARGAAAWAHPTTLPSAAARAQVLSFVALRLDWQPARGPTTALLRSASGRPPLGEAEVAPAVTRRLHESLAVIAQQFGGYLFQTGDTRARGPPRRTACTRPPRGLHARARTGDQPPANVPAGRSCSGWMDSACLPDLQHACLLSEHAKQVAAELRVSCLQLEARPCRDAAHAGRTAPDASAHARAGALHARLRQRAARGALLPRGAGRAHVRALAARGARGVRPDRRRARRPPALRRPAFRHGRARHLRLPVRSLLARPPARPAFPALPGAAAAACLAGRPLGPPLPPRRAPRRSADARRADARARAVCFVSGLARLRYHACSRATRAPARRVEDPEAKGAAGGGGRVEFAGAGPRFAERLAQAVFGGQVVLSEPAWAAIQDQLPGNAQARPAAPTEPAGCSRRASAASPGSLCCWRSR